MKQLKEEDIKFSNDENMLHIGNETYIAEEYTRYEDCDLDTTSDEIAFDTKCGARERKDERNIIWKFKEITNK